jgi:hypothetical protein
MDVEVQARQHVDAVAVAHPLPRHAPITGSGHTP